MTDKISQAGNDLKKVRRRRWGIIAVVFLLLVLLGLAGEYIIVPLIPGLRENASWGFLTEMLGAAITFILIEIAFRQSEENTVRKFEQALELARQDKEAAQKTAQELQTTFEQVQKELKESQEDRKRVEESRQATEKLLKEVEQSAAENKRLLNQMMMQQLQQTLPPLMRALESLSPELQREKFFRQLPKMMESLRTLPINFNTVSPDEASDDAENTDETSDDQS